MVKFHYNLGSNHKKKAWSMYQLTNINPISLTELKKLTACYRTKEYNKGSVTCKKCKLNKTCGKKK